MTDVLRDFLSEAQRRRLDESGYVPVLGNQGRHYRVMVAEQTVVGNIKWMDGPVHGKQHTLGTLCATIRPDHVGGLDACYLAQVMQLTYDEVGFLCRARCHRGRHPLHEVGIVLVQPPDYQDIYKNIERYYYAPRKGTDALRYADNLDEANPKLR